MKFGRQACQRTYVRKGPRTYVITYKPFLKNIFNCEVNWSRNYWKNNILYCKFSFYHKMIFIDFYSTKLCTTIKKSHKFKIWIFYEGDNIYSLLKAVFKWKTNVLNLNRYKKTTVMYQQLFTLCLLFWKKLSDNTHSLEFINRDCFIQVLTIMPPYKLKQY